MTAETVAAYQRQLQVYERALVDLVGEPIVRLMLLFPRVDRAVAVEAKRSPTARWI